MTSAFPGWAGWRAGWVALALTAAACAPKTNLGMPLSKANRILQGLWVDENGARYAFERSGRTLTCTSVVDHDGERFPVTTSGWYGGVFSWTYRVPSTGYMVTHQVTEAMPEAFMVLWQNSEANGREQFTRP